MTDTIIDIFHLTSVDFTQVKAAGIKAIIHKATEGSTFVDKEYNERKKIAKDMGFLWGAYHFSSGGNVLNQVDNFLSVANPDESDMIALDFEPSSDGPNMSIEQARQFVTAIHNELGRFPVIYGGHLLREGVGIRKDAILANCPLWYARYRSSPVGIPKQVWPTFTLWQYTDGNLGDEPHRVAGIGRCDRNRFQGSDDELQEAWPFTHVAAIE